MLQHIQTIGVAGAGTMGSGIALVAAQHGFPTVLFDLQDGVLEQAKQSLLQQLEQLVVKQKISPEESVNIFQHIRFVNRVEECMADCIIEAIVEKAPAKISLFQQLAAVNSPNTVLASNTSSLSITEIQHQIPHPERVAGMHFFNPAPVMKLVEVVKGKHSGNQVIQALKELCHQCQKTPVECTDSPGFIVNRVARHYYLEAMKMQAATQLPFETIDALLVDLGFKMGPFRLMDLIGMDINLATTQSLYEAYQHAVRFTPAPIQVEKVANGELGKKTKQGFYRY